MTKWRKQKRDTDVLIALSKFSTIFFDIAFSLTILD